MFLSKQYLSGGSMVRKKGSEEKLLNEICQEAKLTGRITDDRIAQLTAVFGKRFENGWEAFQGNRVKRYLFKPSGREIWIVVGKERDYQVIPSVGFCSCDDFYFRVVGEGRETHFCYHLIAQRLAEAMGRYDMIEESDDLYETLMSEWRNMGKKRIE
jgi:predicted nucleic acid-binding Zn finger protein